MINSVAEVVSGFKRNWTVGLQRPEIERECKKLSLFWRKRLLDPVTTIQLFLLQILHGNTAISHLRFFTDKSFTTSAYCQARARIPLELLQRILSKMSAGLRRSRDVAKCWHGRKVYLVDGSSFSMPDTPELQKCFGQPHGQKQGCGFPMAHFVALFHVGTGMITEVLSGALFSSDVSQFIKLHVSLKKKDVVVGDRGFCSYAHLAVMARRGVDAVLRVHQKHIVSFRSGRKYHAISKGVPRSRWEKKLGIQDQLVTWFKPKNMSRWMNSNQHRLLPASILLRELSYSVNTRGFRTRKVILVTTLIDPGEFPASVLADLYKQRWNIETNFKHLKTTMGMNILHCRTCAGVLKEFYAFCIVYNLVRTVMLDAALEQKSTPNQISFIDALRWLTRVCNSRVSHLLSIVPKRTGRFEPRAIKRRPKQYDRLNKPRKLYSLKLKNA